VTLSAFEDAWLGDVATPIDVFSQLLGGGSILNGSARDDRFVGRIYATAYNDHLTGDAHDDEFWVGLGSDTITGGGFDMIAYNGPKVRTKGTVVEFTSEQAGTVIGKQGGTATFSEVEAVYESTLDGSFKGV
jgi:hypothetical protein